jgi:hypothetical protein
MTKPLAIKLLFGSGLLLSAYVAVPQAQVITTPASQSPAAAAQSGSPMTMNSQMAQMDRMEQHMKNMQALYDRMTSAVTLVERQKVANEQRREMRESMAVMKPMM